MTRLAISTTEYSSIRETFKAVREEADIINLCIGDPQLSPPPQVADAMRQALSGAYNNYENDAGRRTLREAIADLETRRCGVIVDKDDHIVVTNGGTNGIYSFSRSILDPGDEVLLLDPVWISFVKIIKLLRAIPVFVPTRSESKFVPTICSLTERLTARTKALVVISPGNPTGAVYSAEAMKMLSDFCEQHGLWLLHDEAYQDIIFDQSSRVTLLGMGPHVVSIRTLSKSHNLTGLRVGWVVSQHRGLIARVRKNVAFNVMCVSTLAQIGAESAIKLAGDWLFQNVSTYKRRALAAFDELCSMGLELHQPQGGFYLFPRHSFGRPIAAEILKLSRVAVVDGDHFGPSGTGYFRISICSTDATMAEGLDRIRFALSRLD